MFMFSYNCNKSKLILQLVVLLHFPGFDSRSGHAKDIKNIFNLVVQVTGVGVARTDNDLAFTFCKV